MTKKSFQSIALASFLTVLPLGAQAAKVLKFVTFPIPMMVESPEKGKFIDLAKEVAKRAGYELQIQVVPPKRAGNMFKEGAVQVLFPALEVTMAGEYERSASAYVKVDFAFYRKDKPLKTIPELDGKNVGITLGYPYVKEIIANSKLILQEAESDVTNFKKLESGRIDVFVVEEKTGLKGLADSQAKNIEYDKASPLSKQDVFFAFTKGMKEESEAFSKALESVIQDGTIAKILAP